MRRHFIPLAPRLSKLVHDAASFPEKDRQVQDVVSGDLGATLEAHRKSNLTAKIRKYKVLTDYVYLPPIREDRSARLRTAAQISSVADTEPFTHESILSDSVVSAIEHAAGKGQGPWKPKAKRQARLSRTDAAYAQGSGSYVMPVQWKDTGGLVTLSMLGLQPPFQADRHAMVDQMIRRLEDWARPKEEELQCRKQLISNITEYLEPRFPFLVFRAFGSTQSGLAISSSDIDIGFCKPPRNGSQHRPMTTNAGEQVVKKMRNMLSRSPNLRISHIVRKGRAPLISLVHNNTGVKIQIVHTSTGDRVLPFIAVYLDEFPQLRPLFILMKLAIEARDLHEPRTGGLGSYMLFTMLVAYFKHTVNSKYDTMGEKLTGFLDFYSELNTGEDCVAADPPALFPKRSDSSRPAKSQKTVLKKNDVLYWQSRIGVLHGSRPYLLCLQDPADPSNDLGARAHRIMDIRMTFRTLSRKLKDWLNNEGEVDAKGADPLQPFLGHILGHIQSKRRRMRTAPVSTPSEELLSLEPEPPLKPPRYHFRKKIGRDNFRRVPEI